MARTVTVEEAKSRTAYDLIQEAAQTQQPLIVTLENGKAITIQQYEPKSADTPTSWKDIIYGRDGTGSASADNGW